MKIKITSLDLYEYQKEAKGMMSWLRVQYDKELDPLYNSQNLFTKVLEEFKLFFKWPPSLRFYHKGEGFVKDDVMKKKVSNYRVLWHKYWAVVNQIPKAEKSYAELWLNDYESEVVLGVRLRKQLLKEVD